MKKKLGIRSGFTLIELLIVVAMAASVTTIVVGVIASTLRGANKSITINKVRENGNYAISQMSRTIKYAKTIEGGKVNITDPSWSCQNIPQAPTPTPVPIHYKFVNVTAFDGTSYVFGCDEMNSTILMNASEIIDAGPTGSVTLIPGSCYFTCSKGFIDTPAVGINFILSSKTSSALVESQATIPFSTFIKGRN